CRVVETIAAIMRLIEMARPSWIFERMIAIARVPLGAAIKHIVQNKMTDLFRPERSIHQYDRCSDAPAHQAHTLDSRCAAKFVNGRIDITHTLVGACQWRCPGGIRGHLRGTIGTTKSSRVGEEACMAGSGQAFSQGTAGHGQIILADTGNPRAMHEYHRRLGGNRGAGTNFPNRDINTIHGEDLEISAVDL